MQESIKAIVVSIGDELLIGQTINTNAGWIGKELSNVGVHPFAGEVIQDDEHEITKMLDRWVGNVDAILITGGLGPTKDDITKKVLANYFGCELVINEKVLAKISDYFESRGREMLQVNIDQALLPTCAKVLENDMGTASGMWFEKNGTIVISMPGVPYEMKHIMNERVLPVFKEKFLEYEIVHFTVMTQGKGESYLAEIIKDWETELREDGMKLAYLPSPGIVKLRITVVGNDVQVLNQKVNEKVEALQQLIPKLIFGYNGVTLEEVVGELLKDRNESLSTAESCTGGYVAHLITSITGSSAYYQGSLLSYSNDVKINELNVSSSDLINHGAVSQEVVEQMAQNVRTKLGTTYGVATSGIAGPDGGTEEKPVGTVWIAVADENKVYSKKLQLGNNRERNIKVSSIYLLNTLRLFILDQI